MVKQWLHEAELGLAGSSREAARVRQYRYDGLRKWQVGTIVAMHDHLSLPSLTVSSSLAINAMLVVLTHIFPSH